MVKVKRFHESDVPPIEDFGAIPAGEYEAIITASAMRTTKAGNGKYLELSFEILSGAFSHRTLIARLNLENPSEKAVDIARASLLAICRAVGIEFDSFEDSEQLHDQQLLISVQQRERYDTGGVYAEIIGYRPLPAETAGGSPDASSDRDDGDSGFEGEPPPRGRALGQRRDGWPR